MQTEPISKITNEKKDKALVLNWKKISVSTEKKFQLVYNWIFFQF